MGTARTRRALPTPQSVGSVLAWLRRVLLPVLALTLVAAACQGSVSTDPQSVRSCDRLVDVAVASARQLIDAGADLTQSDFDMATPAAVEVQQQYRRRTDAIAQRATELECDNQTLLEEYRSKVLDISPETEGGIAAQQFALLLPPFRTGKS